MFLIVGVPTERITTLNSPWRRQRARNCCRRAAHDRELVTDRQIRRRTKLPDLFRHRYAARFVVRRMSRFISRQRDRLSRLRLSGGLHPDRRADFVPLDHGRLTTAASSTERASFRPINAKAGITVIR